MDRAQLFTTDFILAALTFLVIVLTFFVFWDLLDAKQGEQADRMQMELFSEKILDALLSSPGQPVDWETETTINLSRVTRLGIVDEQGRINPNKVLALSGSQNYESVRQLLGLKAAGYEFIFTDLKLYDGIIGEGFRIGYTFADSDQNCAIEDCGLRDFLIQNGIPFIDYADDWASLINSIEDYDLVIFEDPELKVNDLSSAQREALKTWVNDSGGIYFHKEHGRMFEIFDLKFTNNAQNEDGTVVQLDPMLKNLELGDTIIAKEGYELNKNFGNLTSLIESNAGHTLVGYREYGKGKVYYIPDTEGSVLNANGSTLFSSITPVINFNGEIDIGKAVNGSHVVVKERIIPSTDGGFIRLSLKLWKE